MNRPPVLLLGTAALLLALGSGAWWATRRTPGAPPQEELITPFHAAPAGAGTLIEFQPSSTPLRSLRWAAALPGGAAVAQILSQSGRQQVVLFQQGEPGPVLSLPVPPEASSTFFRFADLTDAALVPGEFLILLYRGSGEAVPGLILAWDLRNQRVRWSRRAPGERIALSPDRRSLFLFGTGPVTVFDLGAKSSGTAPQPITVELPPEVKGVSSLFPTGSRSFLVAHASGLSSWRNGTWTHTPAPPSSSLGFPAGLGRLAGNTKGIWWQPEPGTLIPLGTEGTPGEAKNLKALLPETAGMDASLLHLLGEAEDGALWFGLTRPSLPPVAPAPEAALPSGEPEAGLPAPVPSPVAPAPQPTREAWEAHLKTGLDRLYRWVPGEGALRLIALPQAWTALAPPPGLPCPAGDGGLRPEAGALLCGGPERAWWLPLRALQPR